MLKVLKEHGEEAGSDFNDSEEVSGWFGWSIDDDQVLTVTYTPADGGGAFDAGETARWRLVPVVDSVVS